MTAARARLTLDLVRPLVREALGRARRAVGVQRLMGGSKKGTYRVVLDDGTTVVVHAWTADEDYWPGARDSSRDDPADPFSPGTGFGLFASAVRELTAAGARTPEVYLLREPYAVVQDLPGPGLEELLDRDPARARSPLDELAQSLALMRERSGPAPGKAGPVRAGHRTGRGTTCAGMVYDRALADLAEAAARVPAIAEVRERVRGALAERYGRVAPREELSLVHGELGPDHVRLDARLRPVLIDVESTMFFDAEWEHGFLRLRFGHHYPRLVRGVALDPHRLSLYVLAHRLSLVAGPLRLLDGDFPDRASMLSVVRAHTAGVRAAVGR
ncbi:aminoglycoside phosphotransferase family protein [Streptomyces sp. NPDC007088]|uniref:aminoglycoside phosphotransferase family protein n=1 Tax=Streptomyces sp. NPDC007088 TaxID=3364773 RepID=UPI00369630EB